MKRTLTILSLLVLASFFVNAQCLNMAKELCKTEMEPYIHNGNYNYTILAEGQEAEVYKTFYADTEYRLLITGEEGLPVVEFEVLDKDRNVLFSNKDQKELNHWDFKLDESQKLIISIKMTRAEDRKSPKPMRGCVSVLVGIQNDE